MTEETVEPQGSCILCFRRDPKPGEGEACWPCCQRLRDWLDELVDLWTHHLPDEVLTGAGRVNFLAIDLMMPVPSIHSQRIADATTDGLVPHIITRQRLVPMEVDGGTRQVVTWERELVRNADGSPALVPAGDQSGKIPTLRWLDSWVRCWQEARADTLAERLPTPTPDRLGGWLRNRVDWASNWPDVSALVDFAAELHEHLRLMRRVTGMSALPLPVPCPQCDMLTLTRFPNSKWEECRFCHALVGPARTPGRADPRPGEYDEKLTEALEAAEMEQTGGAA